MKKLRILVTGVLLFSGATGFLRAQNLVSNGNFELPSAGSTFTARSAGSSMSGWTIGGGGIDHIGGFWRAASANQSVDLNMSSAGSVYQLLSTAPGQEYVLRFAMAGNPFGYTNKLMSVLWGGATLTNLVFPYYSTNNTTNMGWRYHTMLVSATGTSTRLEFSSQTGTMAGSQGTTAYYGPALDDVSVVPFVPPRLEMPFLTNGSTILSWSTFAGLEYELMFSTNLATWAPASEWLIAAETNLSVAVPLEPSRRMYYRVLTGQF